MLDFKEQSCKIFFRKPAAVKPHIPRT